VFQRQSKDLLHPNPIPNEKRRIKLHIDADEQAIKCSFVQNVFIYFALDACL